MPIAVVEEEDEDAVKDAGAEEEAVVVAGL
jgi:hypothetical protein